MILHRAPASRSGFVLFEAILALIIFSLAVMGLTEALQKGIETAGRIGFANKVRIGLRSFIEETRRKQIAEMATQSQDDQLGVTYTSTVEPLTLKNVDGTVLVDLYVMHAKAEWGEGNDADSENVDLYLYEPSGQNPNNPEGTTNAPNGQGTTGSTTSGASGSSTSGASSGSK